MAIYRVRGPDGAIYRIEGPDDATDEQIEAFAAAQFGTKKAVTPTEQPESGFIPATKAGIASLKSDVAGLLGRTGLMDVTAAEQYRKEQEAYQRRVFKPTEEGWTGAPVTKVAELLGGSLPYMAAPLAAGAAAAAAPVSAPIATALGLGAAGLTSAAQFTGSNISRQIEEGKRLEETELGSAAAAAVPQAALDLVSFRMTPLIRRIFTQAGKEVPEAAAKQIAQQKVGEIAKDYALATGKTMGVEGLTESGQQVLERLQAGLNIADPAARDEYFESFIGGAVLGGTLAPAGRFVERGGEKRKQEAAERLRKMEEQAAAEKAAAEEASQKRAAELGTPLLTGEEAERPLFTDEKGKVAAYTDLVQREQQIAEREQAKKDAQDQYTEITKSINDLREQAQTAGREKSIQLGQQAAQLEKLKTDLEKRVADKQDPIYKAKLQPFTQLTQEEAEKKLTPYDALEAQIKRAQAAFDKAKDQGDVVAQGKAAQKLKDLQEELRGTTPDLFGVEGQKVIEERKKADELEERRTVFNAALLMLGKRAERAQSREELEEITTQQEALKKLEFGLERMGLNVLGVTGAKRIKREAELDKGVISPVMAKKLGIYDDQFNALEVRLAKAATPEEAATIEEEITALEQKSNKPTRAVDALDDIETAYQNALAKQKETVDAVAADKFNPFDAKGQLTPQGKLAVANEAILRQLANLRRIGRESKEVLEGQRAEDLFAAAPLKSEAEAMDRTEAFGKAVGKAAEPTESVTEEAEAGRPFANRNEAFIALKDAAIQLQRGQFFGARTAAQGVPSYEEERSNKIKAQITAVENEIRRIRGPVKRVDDKDVPVNRLSPAAEKRITQLQGRLRKLKAGLSDFTAQGKSLYTSLVKRAEQAANYMVDSAITEIKADRVARGFGEMPASEARDLETKLRVEVNSFLDRVTAAERPATEKEKKPVVRIVDGKPVVKRALVPVENPRRRYQKIAVGLNTLRNEIEATVTEAKGLPQRGEVEEMPVEKVEKPVEKAPTPKTEAQKAKYRASQEAATNAAARIRYAQETISKNQQEAERLTEQLRTIGTEVATLRKAAAKDRNPQLRLEKAERVEAKMQPVRERLTLLRNINKQLAAMLNKFGVETGRVQSGEDILFRIEEDIGIAEKPTPDLKDVKSLQDVGDKARKDRKEAQAKIAELTRENYKLARQVKFNFGGQRTKIQNKIQKNKDEISKLKDSIKFFDQRIAKSVAGVEREEVVEEKPQPRFTSYQLDLAIKALDKRIEQTQARLSKTERVSEELDIAARGRLGLGLAGTRVTTTAEPSLVRRPQADIDIERAEIQARKDQAVAKREAIKKANIAAGKPVKTPEWQEAHNEAMNLQKTLNAVKEFEVGFMPVRKRIDFFVDPETGKEVTKKRAKETADFLADKPEDAEVVADELFAIRTEMLDLAKKQLAAAKTGKDADQAAKRVKYWQNRVAEAAVYKTRSKLSKKEEAATDLKENTADVEEISLDDLTDKDMLDAIRFNSDEIDFRFGEAATELINKEEAVKLLEEVKAKAKAQGIEFEYYDNLSQVPIGMLKQMAKQGMDTVASQLKGGVYKGKPFVIVENHNNITDLKETLAHELVGHYSFDGLLGREGMIKLSKQIDKTPGGLGKLAEDLGGKKLRETVEGVFLDTVSYYKQAFDDGKVTEAQIQANARVKALREMVAYTMEKDVTATRMEKLRNWYKALVGAARAGLRKLGLNLDISTSDLFYLMRQAKRNFEAGKPIAYRDFGDGTISFRRTKEEPPSTGLGAIVAKPSSTLDKIKANVKGLNFRVQFLDRLAALDALVKRGVDEGLISSLKALDVMYFNRKADQRNNFVAQFATSGVVKLGKKDGEYQFLAGDGPSLKDVSDALSESGVPSNIVEDEFTQYEIALRAKDVGVDKLDFSGKKVTQKQVDATIAKYSGKDQASVAFQKAHKLYQQYNRDLIDLNVAAGSMTPKLGAKLKSINYVPFYRVNKGVAELVVFGEQPIRIGDMKNQPYLHELVGGEQQILPVFTGALQNTQLLVDMALKNLATRNTAFVLAEMGIAKIHKDKGPASTDVIRFKVDGEDKWAQIDTEAKQDLFGDIPTELVVQGMEGIKTTLPIGIKLLGMPANWLRSFVTRDPRYAIRQIFRDSMAGAMTTGANFVPVVQTLKDMTTMKRGETYKKLQASGSLGGQVVVGATDDMQKILKQLASGKPGWAMAMAKLDELAMMGDAATRVSMYNSFIRQGLSERQADFATMEAMNFSRRGLSPTILYANTLIPFFNASVQGLDVLYRAATGQMAFNERLNVKRKLFARMGIMAVMTLLYAAMMEDDETYENANPDERYNNWFVPTPLGTFRVPIPFELGLVAKGLPEGAYRMAFTDDKNEDVLKALKDLALRSVPGDMPTVAKPAVELMLNRSFFTGREIVDKSMSDIAKYQYRPNTPETIKLFGEIGLSPAKVEYFIKGYTGSLPIGLISAIENVSGISTTEKAKPSMRISDVPIFGGLFQPPDASGIINRAYETVNSVEGAVATYNRLAKTDPKEASEFLKENKESLIVGDAAGSFRQQMGKITQYERVVRESRTLSAEDKRERLDRMKQLKIRMSKQFNEMTARTERQASR